MFLYLIIFRPSILAVFTYKPRMWTLTKDVIHSVGTTQKAMELSMIGRRQREWIRQRKKVIGIINGTTSKMVHG